MEKKNDVNRPQLQMKSQDARSFQANPPQQMYYNYSSPRNWSPTVFQPNQHLGGSGQVSPTSRPAKAMESRGPIGQSRHLSPPGYACMVPNFQVVTSPSPDQSRIGGKASTKRRTSSGGDEAHTSNRETVQILPREWRREKYEGHAYGGDPNSQSGGKISGKQKTSNVGDQEEQASGSQTVQVLPSKIERTGSQAPQAASQRQKKQQGKQKSGEGKGQKQRKDTRRSRQKKARNERPISDKPSNIPSLVSVRTPESPGLQIESHVIVQTLLQNFNGRAPLERLQHSMPMYREQEFYTFFQANKYDSKSLLLFENPKALHKSVLIVYHSRLKLCVSYNDVHQGCQTADCICVHLCRDFLTKGCGRDACQLSHAVEDSHNSKVLNKWLLRPYVCSQQLMLIHSSNPKVCPEYNSVRGCERSGSCPDVHICDMNVQNKCHGCSLNHDVSECISTLQKYLARISNMAPDFVEKMIIPTGRNEASDANKFERKTKTCLDEEKIFQMLLHEFQGKTTVKEMKEHFETMNPGMDVEKVADWFKTQKRMRLFEHKVDLGLSVVVVHMKALKFCFMRECQGHSCGFLHICREFIFGNCKEKKCKFEHNLRSSHNNEILKKNGLEAKQYDEEAVKHLLFHSHLKSCTEYGQQAKCQAESQGTCPDIHICPHFIQGNCMMPDRDCPKSHDLMTVKSMKTLRKYGLEHLNSDRARRQIFTVKMMQKDSMPDKNRIRIHDSDTFICESHIRHKCKKGSLCPYHHYPMPYLWQIKYEDTWLNLRKKNVEIETAFCDVYSSTLDVPLEDQKFVTLNFETFRWRNTDGLYQGDMRRLTTMSYIEDSDNSHFTTSWLWYWQDGQSDWFEYGETGDPPSQDVLEWCFSNKSQTYHFEYGDEYAVHLDRDHLRQENLSSHRERLVRRRPLLVEEMDVLLCSVPRKPVRCYNPSDLPAGWQPMDTKTPEAYEKITVPRGSSKYTEVKQKFRKTMGSNNKIKKVFKIQNLTHWNNYIRKKDTMCKLYHNNKIEVDEMQLFHGTDDDTLQCIFSQNFDPRMHGKNACRYGMGVYFYKDASYSHKFTGSDQNKSMFYAKVLTGRKTVGSSEMKRPPPVDPLRRGGELYGSCVDNEVKPNIFVVFERDQCYPEYLIQYQHVPTPKPPRKTQPPITVPPSMDDLYKRHPSSTTRAADLSAASGHSTASSRLHNLDTSSGSGESRHTSASLSSTNVASSGSALSGNNSASNKASSSGSNLSGNASSTLPRTTADRYSEQTESQRDAQSTQTRPQRPEEKKSDCIIL